MHRVGDRNRTDRAVDLRRDLRLGGIDIGVVGRDVSLAGPVPPSAQSGRRDQEQRTERHEKALPQQLAACVRIERFLRLLAKKRGGPEVGNRYISHVSLLDEMPKQDGDGDTRGEANDQRRRKVE